jgi:hypothetical protein
MTSLVKTSNFGRRGFGRCGWEIDFVSVFEETIEDGCCDGAAAVEELVFDGGEAVGGVCLDLIM